MSILRGVAACTDGTLPVTLRCAETHFNRKSIARLPTRNPPMSTFAFAADFFEQLDLDLLNLEEAIVLPSQQVIDFFVQVPDFEFGLEIDLIIVFRAQPVTRFHAVLAHHDRSEERRVGKECRS